MITSERLLLWSCLLAAGLTPILLDPQANEPLGAAKWLVSGMMAMVIALVLAWRGRLPRALKTTAGKALIACFAVALASSFGAIIHATSIDELLRLSCLALLAIGAAEIDWSARRILWLVAAITGAAVINGWLALCEYYAVDWWTWKFTQTNRLVALFGHQNTLAQFLIQPLLMLFTLFLTKGHKLAFAFFVFVQGVVIITLCRGAWVAEVCGMLFTLWLFRGQFQAGRRFATGILATVILVWATHYEWGAKEVADAPFTYKQDVTILTQDSNRTTFIKQSIAAIQERPLLGAGPGNFPVAYQQVDKVRADYRRYAHIDVLHWGVETGLIGLVALAWLCFATLRSLKPAPPMVVAALVGTFIHSLVSYNFYMPASATTAAVLLGITFSCNSTPSNPSTKNKFALLAILILCVTVTPRLSAEARVSRLEKRAFTLIRNPPVNREDFRRRSENALVFLNQALELRPHDPHVLQRTAQLHLQLGDLHKARTVIEQLQRITPYNDNIHLMAAHIHNLRRDIPAQIESLEKAVNLAVNQRTIEDELWLLYHVPGTRYQERLKKLEDKFSKEGDWFSHRRQLAQRVEKSSSAGPLFMQEMEIQDRLQREGDRPELLAQLASIHYQFGRFEASLNTYRSALKLIDNGAEIDPKELADLLMGAGNVHVHQKFEDKGFILFRRGRELFPDEVRFFEPFFRRELYDKGWKAALELLDTALENTSSNRFRHRAAIALGEHAQNDKIELLEGLALLNKQCELTKTGLDYFERARFHQMFFDDHHAEARKDYQLAINIGLDIIYENISRNMLIKLEHH